MAPPPVALALPLGSRLSAAIPPGQWRIGLALLALPVMLLHDALLTGDPFYWARVSAVYGDALASIGALPDAWSAARQAVDVPLGMPVLSILALVGTLALIGRRAWPILVGLLAVGPGMGLFLVALAASGRFVDPRYLIPIQAVILVAAATGIGALASLIAARLEGARSRRVRGTVPARRAGGTVLASRAGSAMPAAPARRAVVPGRGIAASALVLVGALVALLATPAIGPLDASTQATLDRFHRLAHSADVAEPVLAEQLADFKTAREWPGNAPISDRKRSDIFAVPGNLRPRLALDLDVPLTRLVATDTARLDPSRGAPPPGEIVFHSGGDLPAPGFASFEIASPSLVGPVLLVPLFHDAAAATWIVRIDSTGGFSSSGGGLRR